MKFWSFNERNMYLYLPRNNENEFFFGEFISLFLLFSFVNVSAKHSFNMGFFPPLIHSTRLKRNWKWWAFEMVSLLKENWTNIRHFPAHPPASCHVEIKPSQNEQKKRGIGMRSLRICVDREWEMKKRRIFYIFRWRMKELVNVEMK